MFAFDINIHFSVSLREKSQTKEINKVYLCSTSNKNFRQTVQKINTLVPYSTLYIASS